MAWFPGAIRDPGKNAGFRSGRIDHRVAILHFTVGRDSRALIRNQGLAQFLFPKVGKPYQFAEADAVCSHACEWNRTGPGLEFERMNWDEPLTKDQLLYGGQVIKWLAETYGYPLKFHSGSRLPIGGPFRGFANHGSLVHRACDQHTDGVTRSEWNAMVGDLTSSKPPLFPGDDSMLLATIDGKTYYAFVWGQGVRKVSGAFAAYYQGPKTVITQADFDALKTLCD